MSRQPHPLATLAQIVNTPSRSDGVPRQVENDLRAVGCMLIQEAGVMLDLPQATIATAQVLLHRFYFVSSLCSFGVTDISISSLFLATKLNETPIRLRNLINTYIYLTARIRHLLSLPPDRPLPLPLPLPSPVPSQDTDLNGIIAGAGSSSTASVGGATVKGKERAREAVWEGMEFQVPGFHDEVFWEWKDVITAGEMQILKRLGFNMQVDLPYNHAINYLKILDLVFEPKVSQTVWSILNDALLTPVYAIQPPHTLACASILLATRRLRIPLPRDWYRLFDVEWDDIWSVAGTVMVLYKDWDWGSGSGSGLSTDADVSNAEAGVGEENDEDKKIRMISKENRWRRAWVLCEGRKAVRRWVEENERRLGGAGAVTA